MAQYALDKLTFNFRPDNIPAPEIETGDSPDQQSANDIYRQVHKMVYNEWPKSDLGRHWQAAVSNARAAKMDFKTFCLYVIAGFFVTHEYTKFYPSNLSASSSVGKLEGFRKACLRKMGASDARSLGLMLNIEFHAIDDEMLTSEVSFGRYVTGMVDTDNPCAEIFEQDEISFSPYWLAIEPDYTEVVYRPYFQAKSKIPHFDWEKHWTKAQLRHRHLVGQVRSVLIRRSHLASTVFNARSRIMPKAVKSVLDYHGMKPTSPISDKANVDDAFEFWKQVGAECADWKKNYGVKQL